MNYGQNPWPPLGSSVGHERAGLLSATGHVLLTVDTENAGSIPVTRSTEKAQVSRHPRRLGLRRSGPEIGVVTLT